MHNGNIPFRTMIDLVETANRIDESGGDIDHRQVIMRRISEKIAQVVNELADDLYGGAGYDWGEVPRMQAYSGRGMYGKYCLGVSVGRYASTDLLKKFKKNGIPDPSRDQLGMGHIYYWQNIPHDPVIHKNTLKRHESVESADALTETANRIDERTSLNHLTKTGGPNPLEGLYSMGGHIYIVTYDEQSRLVIVRRQDDPRISQRLRKPLFANMVKSGNWTLIAAVAKKNAGVKESFGPLTESLDP